MTCRTSFTKEEIATYEAFILVDPETAITFEQAAAALQETSFSVPATLTTIRSEIIVRLDEFHFTIAYSAKRHVLEESEELAEEFGQDHPHRARIMACHTRFEITSERDLDMDYFNDYLYIFHTFEALGRVYLFDPRVPGFIDQD